MVFSKPCLHCGGTGQQRQTRCPACRRRSASDADRVDDDQRAARAGRRRADPASRARDTSAATAARPATSTSTSPCGRIRCFERDGDDLHVTVPVARPRSGARREDRRAVARRPGAVRVPPGTQSGQRFRVRERGVPSPRDGRRGDLVVEVQLVLPQAARRAVEGAAAGVRPDQRGGCSTGAESTQRTLRTQRKPGTDLGVLCVLCVESGAVTYEEAGQSVST